jgi:hypothetical protein
MRVAGGAVALLAIVVLSLRVLDHLLEPAQVGDPTDEVALDEPATLVVSATERLAVRIEADGNELFDGVICSDCDLDRVEATANRELAVELSDLTRARVIYNGRRVEPLGNLSAPRRLVFIDDR